MILNYPGFFDGQITNRERGENPRRSRRCDRPTRSFSGTLTAYATAQIEREGVVRQDESQNTCYDE